MPVWAQWAETIFKILLLFNFIQSRLKSIKIVDLSADAKSKPKDMPYFVAHFGRNTL